MKFNRTEEFAMLCSNATDNKLINIAMDELQKIEDNEDDASTEHLQMVAEEMEKRGLDINSVKNFTEDYDSSHERVA
jgi:hypothetical protein